MYARVATACAVLIAFGTAAAQEQDFSKVEVKVTSLAGSVYLLQGAGGNIGASVGEDGVVLVDDDFAPMSGKITEALKGIGKGNAAVRYVLLTHYHRDHVGGNLPFAKAGATIIGQDNLRTTLMSDHFAGNGGSLKLPANGVEKAAQPTISFDRSLTVHVNGEDVHAEHFAGAHTSGDSIVFFETAHIVHMGDIYVRYGFPFIDVNTGGSVQGMIAACEAVLARLPADGKIIPGHGEVASADDLREYVKFLKDTSAVVAQGIKAGKSLDQMTQDNVLGPWTAKYNGKFINANAFLESLYYSLAGTAPAAKH
jgi:glyoxylase-like metal-dependent hydrolase (beta-lactamase superfamily II)